jgi:hypothetical protein
MGGGAGAVTSWGADQLKELLEGQIVDLRREVAEIKAQREADRKAHAASIEKVNRLVYMGVGMATVVVVVVELALKRLG